MSPEVLTKESFRNAVAQLNLPVPLPKPSFEGISGVSILPEPLALPIAPEKPSFDGIKGISILPEPLPAPIVLPEPTFEGVKAVIALPGPITAVEFKEASGLSILPKKAPQVSFKGVSAPASFAVKGETPKFEEVRIEVGMSALYPSGKMIPATYGLRGPLGAEAPSLETTIKKEKDKK